MLGWLKRYKSNTTHDLKYQIKCIDQLPDDELKILNNLLPWASYVNDSSGRHFGKPFSSKKRSTPEKIPDPRIVELNRRYPLRDLRVLEVGCFEGNHTVGLAQFSDHITAIDSRIEHIVKTIIRTAMFGYRPNVFRLDLEQPLPRNSELTFDVLHHVGVLYHLTDPVTHLHEILPKCRIIMLDTHIATERDALQTYQINNVSYHYKKFRESGRMAPFAGMKDHAKWLLEKDIISLLEFHGFTEIEITEHRDERNGKRILLYAHKQNDHNL